MIWKDVRACCCAIVPVHERDVGPMRSIDRSQRLPKSNKKAEECRSARVDRDQKKVEAKEGIVLRPRSFPAILIRTYVNCVTSRQE